MKKLKKITNWKTTIINFLKNNSKEYLLVIIIFIIGMFIGVMLVNNTSAENQQIIENYILNFIEKLKLIANLDKLNLLTTSIKDNIILAIALWIAGTTIIGMPIVFGIILFRGFCFGYTVAAVTFTLGLGKGIFFCILSLFLQNIFFILAILTIGVSSIKLYKSIIADRRKENIKIEIVRHTVISLLMLVVLIFSSFIENRISVNLLKFGIKYF